LEFFEVDCLSVSLSVSSQKKVEIEVAIVDDITKNLKSWWLLPCKILTSKNTQVEQKKLKSWPHLSIVLRKMKRKIFERRKLSC